MNTTITLVKALARAWRWQRMLDEGVYTSVSEIGDAESISKRYVSRILRLALLAPDLRRGDPGRAGRSGADAGEAGAAAASDLGHSRRSTARASRQIRWQDLFDRPRGNAEIRETQCLRTDDIVVFHQNDLVAGYRAIR